MYLPSYPMPTLRGARYAAWEDFAFSFMLIVATRALGDKGITVVADGTDGVIDIPGVSDIRLGIKASARGGY